jgi:hypothetical protein
VHVAAPAPLYFPSGQIMQVSLDDAPISIENFPAVQFLQTLATV